MAAVTWLVDPYPSSTGPLEICPGALTAWSQQVALGPLPELKDGGSGPRRASELSALGLLPRSESTTPWFSLYFLRNVISSQQRSHASTKAS